LVSSYEVKIKAAPAAFFILKQYKLMKRENIILLLIGAVYKNETIIVWLGTCGRGII